MENTVETVGLSEPEARDREMSKNGRSIEDVQNGLTLWSLYRISKKATGQTSASMRQGLTFERRM